MPIQEIEEEISFTEYESGRYLKQTDYESFIPTPINHGWICPSGLVARFAFSRTGRSVN